MLMTGRTEKWLSNQQKAVHTPNNKRFLNRLRHATAQPTCYPHSSKDLPPRPPYTLPPAVLGSNSKHLARKE
eukprot:3530732-Pleurochrysis_carterae.AAC.1